MAKLIDGKGIVHALLLSFVLRFSSFVGAAVDIYFYDSIYDCSGTGYAFEGVYSNTCCSVVGESFGSVTIFVTSGGDGCLGGDYYENGDCTTLADTSLGNTCFYDGDFTGAAWYDACGGRRRSLLGGRECKPPVCNAQMKPTGVVFTEDGAKGNWILTSSNATELYSLLKNVRDAEKVNWIKSQGATYQELDSALQIESKKLGN